jgi:hypothetical protein
MTPRQKAAIRELVAAFQEEHEGDTIADPDAVADPRTIEETKLKEKEDEVLERQRMWRELWTAFQRLHPGVSKADLERCSGVDHAVRLKVFRGEYSDNSEAAKKLLDVIEGRIPIQIRRKKMTGFERSRLTSDPDTRPVQNTADPYTAK